MGVAGGGASDALYHWEVQGLMFVWCALIGIFPFRWPAICIHGDKAQQEREWVLEGNTLISYWGLAIHSVT